MKGVINNLKNISSKYEYNSYKKIVDKINEIKFDLLDNEEILKKSYELKDKVSKGACLDDIVIEAFALVKEAIKRVLSLNAYDEQLIAGIGMHKGRLIEMQTGEGKTLAAVFPAYLNALTGNGCHILTFNDYLARRDALWMGPVYQALGLTVGFIQDNMKSDEKRKAYNCDITYLTAKLAGFDYLRDLLCYKKSEIIQRPFNFAIIDEADSIIIDEARIPLVIATGEYYVDSASHLVAKVVKKLEPKLHYDKDEFKKNVYLTDGGLTRVEEMLCCDNLYAEENFNLLNRVHNSLYAEVLLKRDIDYIVRDEKIEMIDEFTGRVAENRHWPDGLQAALEAKEGLGTQSKGRIMNQITLQSFILLYKKIAGMTATAIDSAEEIGEFYGMDVLVIPSHIPCIRKDYKDTIFTHKEAKFKAIIEEVKKVHSTGQPILIGTSSVKESEYLARNLNEAGIECEVLNAKNDELEASIIEQAGTLGAVTVSTNMAGRGTDIKLGGSKEIDRDKIVALGGLYVIGTSRQESKRIDKQLRGRAGRQGDPGMSKFYVSLEDKLIEKYGIDKIIPEFIRPKPQEEPLLSKRIAKKIEQVQRIIQGQNTDLRRTLWRYSFFIEKQRLQVHKRRREILEDTLPFNILSTENEELYKKLVSVFGEITIKELEKQVTLYNIDNHFADYLENVIAIQETIHLRMLNGKNPLQEFEVEIAKLFEELNDRIESNILDDFERMELSKKGLNTLRERIKPPLSTWTYVVNDKTIIDSLALSLIGMGGVLSAGLIFAGPVLSAILSFKRFLYRIRKGNYYEE